MSWPLKEAPFGTVTKNDDKAVLGAVKTGEQKALSDYEDALNKPLPEEVRSVVNKQKEKIEASYKWVEKQV